MRALQPGIVSLWDQVFAGSHVPDELCSVCWVLSNSAGVIPILERYSRSAHLFQGDVSLPTRDFERLYTGLPQEDIVARLSALLQMVWELHPAQPFLLVTADGHQWLAVTQLPIEAQGGAASSFSPPAARAVFVHVGSHPTVIGIVSHPVFLFSRGSSVSTGRG